MKKLLLSSSLITPITVFAHNNFSDFTCSATTTVSLITTPTTYRLKSTAQQSYVQALAISTLIGSCNAIGCCYIEKIVPLWRPFNIIVARIGATLLLPSFVYAYLAFAEGSGITCHSTTMQAQALLADWTTYLIIKNVHY